MKDGYSGLHKGMKSEEQGKNVSKYRIFSHF